MMISEIFYGHEEVFSGWRCISCGEIIDSVILKNRIDQTQEAPLVHLDHPR